MICNKNRSRYISRMVFRTGAYPNAPSSRPLAQPDRARWAGASGSDPVFTRWDYPVYAAISVFNLAAILYLLEYWFSEDDWRRHPVLFALLTLVFVFNLALHQLRWSTLPLMRRPRPVIPPAGYRVAVVTTFVPGAEPLPMLDKTLRALVAMDYPHETWVLDEGDREEIKALCQRLGAHHFSRKGRARYQANSGPFLKATKYGNYNAWLTEIGYSGYDIVSAFDPDHIPRRDFLNNVLGHFTDAQVGYVQAAQAYYNQEASFIARGAAEQTYTYSSSIQMAGYAVGYPIIMGCHNTHRTAALAQVGGFAAHDADDLLLTIYYRAAGWRGVYVPQILARGLTPVDWRGYLVQQRRWARSVLDVKFRIYPGMASKLAARERLVGYVHGLYWVQGLSPAMSIGLLAYMLVTGSVPTAIGPPVLPRLGILCVTLAVAEAYRQRFFLGGRAERGVHWRALVLEWAKWPAMLMALLDVVSRRRNEYVITRKIKVDSQSPVLRIPHGLAAVVVASAWALGVTRQQIGSPILHAATAAVVLLSLCLIASEDAPKPEPYDPLLYPNWQENCADRGR